MVRTNRKIIQIDEEKCNGCGLCIPSCKEGALKIVDGKARLVSDVYCDGLGACLGECPLGALTIEERVAEEFDESLIVHEDEKLPCGCPGAFARTLEPKNKPAESSACAQIVSELRQWPVQLALIPVHAPYLKNADFVLLADCVAVAHANLHRDFLKNKVVAIACPKLDDTNPYLEKLVSMITINNFRSIEVVTMEVPCCSGLSYLIDQAVEKSKFAITVKKTIVSLSGEIVV